MKRSSGFTLIELLVVIAIILILIAIALPNFLEVQTRAKVARVHNDLRTTSIALESYAIDFRSYPLMEEAGFDGGVPPLADSALKWWYIPNALSTPVAYLSDAHLECPFGGNFDKEPYFPDEIWKRYGYENIPELIRKSEEFPILQNRYSPEAKTWSGAWRLQCVGPDRLWNPSVAYAPTNGAASRGDIIVTQKSARGNVNFDSSRF